MFSTMPNKWFLTAKRQAMVAVYYFGSASDDPSHFLLPYDEKWISIAPFWAKETFIKYTRLSAVIYGVTYDGRQSSTKD